jgi:hypothetical protein
VDRKDDLIDVKDDLVDKEEVAVTIVVVARVVLNQLRKNLKKYFFKYLVLQKLRAVVDNFVFVQQLLSGIELVVLVLVLEKQEKSLLL